MKNTRIAFRRYVAVNTRRPAGQNESFGLMTLHRCQRNVMPHNLAVDVLFTDAAGNQPSVLRAKIQYQNSLLSDLGRSRLLDGNLV